MAEYNVGTVEITLATKMDEASKKASSVILQLNKLKGGVKDTKRQIDLTADSSKRLGNNLKKAFDVGKAYVAFNYIKRYSRVLTKAFKYSIDYTETLNKFEVSMDRMFDKAVRFQNKLNEAFGLSKSELMDYQANFNNIVKAMGDIDEEMAYNLSEKLTEMSLDFASLFNTTTEEAMAKFQAALTQQVRPIRSVSGFDITQATMGGVLKQIGIEDRTVQQLSQVEKRLLTIITLQRQMEAIGARGDLAKTIEQPANQLKVMQQVLKDLGIAFGNFVMYSLAPAFSYVNGFLMAIREVFEYLYTLLPKRGGSSNIGSLNDVLQTEQAVGGVKDTKKALKDLKNAMGSIDELNVISPPSDTGGDVGGLGGFGGVDPRLLKAMKDYDNQMERVRMKATAVRDRIMEWLGFTKLVNKETGEVTFKLKEGHTNLWKIITAAKILAGVLGAITIGKGIGNGVKSISLFIKGIKTLTGTSLISKIGQVIALTAGGAGSLLESIKLVFPWVGKLSSAFTAAAGKLGLTTGKLGLVILAITAVLGATIYAVKHWDEIKEKFTELKDDLIAKSKEMHENVATWFKELPEKIGYYLGLGFGKLVGWGKKVKDWFSETTAEIIVKTADFFATLPDRILEKINRVKETIHTWGVNTRRWFREELPMIINTVIGWFKKLPSKIGQIGKNIVYGLWNGICDKWGWFKEKFFGIFGSLRNVVKDVVGGFGKGYKVGYEKVTGYATGGFPTRGDYFLANENGMPEYVGSMGGKTAVANTNQIVDGISIGVYKANAEQNRLLQEQNAYLKQIASKNLSVNLDGRKVSDQINKADSLRGFNSIVGGFAYV